MYPTHAGTVVLFKSNNHFKVLTITKKYKKKRNIITETGSEIMKSIKQIHLRDGVIINSINKHKTKKSKKKLILPKGRITKTDTHPTATATRECAEESGFISILNPISITTTINNKHTIFYAGYIVSHTDKYESRGVFVVDVRDERISRECGMVISEMVERIKRLM